MYRRGHVGVALLAYAPVGYLLLREGRLGLALLGLLGVLTAEPLPDNDFWIPGMSHRGTSHSLFCALVVGIVIGALGWVVGEHLNVLLADTLAGLDTSSVGIFAGVFQWIAEQLRRLNGRSLAVFGFAVGVFGILVHLLADAITVGGIRPFLPLSRRRISLSSLHAESPVANNALFGLGVLVLAVVVFATAPGIGFAAAPADLSPVDVAAGQSTNQSNASVTFSNQTSNGSNVTIESVTLPEGGFVALHGSGYTTGGATADSSIIASSGYLSAGTHTNLSLPVSQAPPANYPGMNQSQLNQSETLTLAVYQDTNDNQQMDFVRSFGENDTAYTSGGNVVSDSAGVTVPTEPRPQASVTFRNQTIESSSDGDLVTVENATLPDGGHIVIHNDSYLPPESAPLESAVGITAYLEPGNYSNVEARLINGSVTEDQTLVAVPYRDTNQNQRYDYVATDGFQDTAYENRTGNETVIINDTASVLVENASTGADVGSGGMDADAPANTSTPFRVTNLTVSNQSARVGDEINVTVQVENPTNSRLEDDLALATAGDTAETQDVALFPRESRTVTYEYSYESAGQYVIKVGNRTAQIRIAEEGAPLTTTTAPTPNGSDASGAQGEQSDDGMGLPSPPVLIVGLLLLVGVGWVLKRRNQSGL